MSDSTSTRKTPSLAKLSVGALGVVFGDIGTSPLYAIKECFSPSHGISLTSAHVLGVLSLIFWSLTLVVSIKYLIFILRADNRGEGGILALLALLIPKLQYGKGNSRSWLVLLGLFGAALLYGDGVITPAISVLSAIEGLQVATPRFQPIVVPLTIAILMGLFWFQKRGTHSIGNVFGPMMLVWFLTIAATGVPWILQHPEILQAISPHHAVMFLLDHEIHGFFVLSAVVLCITGGEALYADMGHFGRGPIQLGWFALAFPCLLVNYFGQGAYILAAGAQGTVNPFFGMVPSWGLYPMVIVSTIATVIASQALISGAYSLTQQAVQLGYLPRVVITHTSRSTEGQIFVPTVNVLLMLSCVSLVLVFQESSRLAAAYGIAVTGTMAITSLLFFTVTRKLWNWPLPLAASVVSIFLAVDLAFFSANIIKIVAGGWVPLVIAGLIFLLMTTWKWCREIVSQTLLKLAVPISDFLKTIEEKKTIRIKGTAVFMTLNRDIAPSVLLLHFQHNQVLHERVILLSILTKNEPEVDPKDRVRITDLSQGFVKVIALYGFMETPDIKEVLKLCRVAGLQIDEANLSYYLGREIFLADGNSSLPMWRKKLFIALSKNARSATEFFKLPPDQVIELGSQISI